MTRLVSFEEVCAHLAVAPGARLPSGLSISTVDVGGAPWLAIVGVIGSARSAPIAATLAGNAASAIGAFCLVDGELALRQLLPLEGLRAADLDRVLKVLEWRVAETRRQLGVAG